MKATATHWLTADARLQAGVVVVALGGNLGGCTQVQARCMSALHGLSAFWGLPCLSGFYVTAPVGEVQNQPDFLNAVAAFKPETTPNASTALTMLLELEAAHGRERLVSGGARTLDLDLLLVGEQCVASDTLVLPHPRMQERAFVLTPLKELFGSAFTWLQEPLSAYLSSPALARQKIRLL